MSRRPTFLRGAVEAGFILVGILLAFWIDAWWDNRQAGQVEAGLRFAVAEELNENRTSLDDFIGRHEVQLDRIDRFLRATPAELATIDRDSIRLWAGAMERPNTFDPVLAAATVLLQTTPRDSEMDLEIRRSVAQWLRTHEDSAEEASVLYAAGMAVAQRQARYAVPSAVDGGDNVAPMLVRLGPGILAQLRADEELVAAVIFRGHVERVYLAGLRAARANLDSISTLLAGEASE